MGELELDGRKPSQFIRRTKTKLNEIGLDPSDDILKHKIIKAMPNEAKISLTASQSLPMDKFCEVADNLYDVLNISSVNHISQPNSQTYSRYGQTNDNRRENKHESPVSRNCYTPYHPDQRPKICKAHVYYADRARTCKN